MIELKRLNEIFIKSLPWVIVALLVVTNVITAAFLLQKTPAEEAKDYPLVDIARSYIPQEHFLVNIQPLRERLFEITDTEPAGTVSIYFEFLNTGSNIQLNNESSFYPASLVKIPSAMVAMKKVERGDWQMDSRLVLFEEDKDPRYGDLHKQPIGTSFTIRQLLEALLERSDNTAHNILMRNLSEQELDELRDDIGLNDLFNEKQEITAKEYSRLFRSLYNSSFLAREGSQQLLEWLTRTRFNDTLPAGMPGGITIAHKIGEDSVELNYHDSGIVYLPNRPYLLTVMVKQHNQKEAQKIMQNVARAAYDYVNAQNENQDE